MSLGGERDIHRLFDRLESLLNEVRDSGPNTPRAAAVAEWRARAADLRSAISMGAFDDGSMFTKVLKNVLTPDQSASYDALKAMRRLGGELSIRPGAPGGPGVVAEIDLTGTEFGDADTGCLARFPHLESLDLRRTGITDGALNQLVILKKLKRLVLNHTRVTDSGTTELARLPGLQELSLVGTHVSETGMTSFSARYPD